MTYNENAAGPIAFFTYVQALGGIQIISVNLAHTKPTENEKKWPLTFRSSSFPSLWRFWSTCKVQTLTSACNEMSSLNPPGKRQVFITTTIKNNLAAITGAHDAYRNAIDSIRGTTGLTWTLVLQPLLPQWARKGDPNPLGLNAGTSEPLVLVSFTVNWSDEKDDVQIKVTTRQAMEFIDKVAVETKSDHPYRYLNYCAEWQKPFEGYGEENWKFLKDTSRKYDPEALFQEGCVGGFKLNL